MTEIIEMTKEREKGFLTIEEWKTIIYYIYDEQDARFLEDKIMEFIKRRIDSIQIKIPNKRLSREELSKLYVVKDDLRIYFKDFSKLVMDFQIKMRESYLKNFVVIFKKIDKDNDGIINESEFFELVKSFNYYGEQVEEEADRLLNIIDPYNNQIVCFSECITLFTNEIIEIKNEKGDVIQMSLLDKISNEEILI